MSDIVSGNKGTAKSKIIALKEAGVLVAPSPTQLGEIMFQALQKNDCWKNARGSAHHVESFAYFNTVDYQ